MKELFHFAAEKCVCTTQCHPLKGPPVIDPCSLLSSSSDPKGRNNVGNIFL